eukprot:gene7423-9774_t
MPKKGNKGNAASKNAHASTAATKKLIDAPGPTQMELSLRLELESLEQELLIAKREAEEAKGQNDFLRAEVERTKEETSEYESYMQKKTMREQLKVQNLSDENQQSLDSIAADKMRKAKEFDDIKRNLKELTLEKESELQRVLQQIEDLDEFARKRQQQESVISQLKQTIHDLEEQHAREISEAKTQFLDEKLQFQREAAAAIQQLEREAATEALECIDEHTTRVKETNKALRMQLIKVFQQTKQLVQREELLRKQNTEVRRLLELNVNVKQPGSKLDKTMGDLSRSLTLTHEHQPKQSQPVRLPSLS